MGQLTSKHYQCSCCSNEVVSCDAINIEITTGEADVKDYPAASTLSLSRGGIKGLHDRGDVILKVEGAHTGLLEGPNTSRTSGFHESDVLYGQTVRPSIYSMETGSTQCSDEDIMSKAVSVSSRLQEDIGDDALHRLGNAPVQPVPCHSSHSMHEQVEWLSDSVHEAPCDATCMMRSSELGGQSHSEEGPSAENADRDEVTDTTRNIDPVLESEHVNSAIESAIHLHASTAAATGSSTQAHESESLEPEVTTDVKANQVAHMVLADSFEALHEAEKDCATCTQGKSGEETLADEIAEDVQVGDIVILAQSVPREYCNRAAIVTNVADSYCTVVVLDECRRHGIGECWPSYESFTLESTTLRLGTRVLVSGLHNNRTKHLNGKPGVISKHPRQGHPNFIQKATCPDPQLTVCVTFEDGLVKERSVLLEPRFLMAWQDASREATRRLSEAASLLLDEQSKEKIEAAMSLDSDTQIVPTPEEKKEE